MASTTPQGANLLRGIGKSNGGKFDKGWGQYLPAAYKKFWNEWKHKTPAAVHYIPKEGMFERNELTGEVHPIQNIPLPLIHPPESDEGLWGGEGIIKGFQKRIPYKRRNPHFWVPVLRRSVVRSEVLNEYMSTTITDRTVELIHEFHGFDHYILKTPACDLRSKLALTLKRKILTELLNGCPNLSSNPQKQKAVLAEYSRYLEQYTAEEIEWYGLTFVEAILKIKKQMEDKEANLPHKLIFRTKLIEQLKEAGIREAQGITEGEDNSVFSDTTTWLSKMNPFGKKKET